MKYKILSAIISIVLMISLVGCQQNNTIIKPDIETKTVTENSEGDYITFSLDIPSNWKLYAQNYTSIACFSPDANKTNASENISPYKLSIDNYIIPSLMPIDDKYKQAYKDLFSGKYDGIKDLICDNIEYINIGKVIDSFPDVTFETPESIMDYFNILVDGISTPDVTMPESWNDKKWATDFTFSEYNGKNGKIIAVEYSYVIIDKTYKAINCYRDDDFSVCGAFDDDADLSSGDLALWVADNMEITKHYKIEDNMIKQEGVDY